MSELNLPDELKQISIELLDIAKSFEDAERLNKVFAALSDARNESQEKSNEIVALNLSLENRGAEVERLREALLKVQRNWEYQKKSGYPHFTSAPTEYDSKRSNKLATEKMVADALRKDK